MKPPLPPPEPPPTLDQLSQRPELAGGLAPEVRQALVLKAAAALAALAVASPTNPAAEAALDDRLLTVPEVAARLGVPASRVRELTRSGTLPSVKIGKYVRVSRRALQVWLAERETKSFTGKLSRPYNSPYEGQGTAAPPPAARAHASGVRRTTGSPLELRSPDGARRDAGPGAGRQARPAPGAHRPAPAPPDDDSDESKW